MRVMVKLVFSVSISSNACRSYPMLPGRKRWTLFSRGSGGSEHVRIHRLPKISPHQPEFCSENVSLTGRLHIGFLPLGNPTAFYDIIRDDPGALSKVDRAGSGSYLLSQPLIKSQDES